MYLTESRDALAKALAGMRATGEKVVPEHGCGGVLDRCLSTCPVPYVEVMPPEEIADALIASGAVTPVATLADDEALTERVSRIWWERDHGNGAPEWDADWHTEVEQVLRALAAALTERSQ